MLSEKQDLLKKITIAFDSLANLFACYIAFIIKTKLLPIAYRGLIINEELWITMILIPFLYYFLSTNFDIYQIRYKKFKDIVLNSFKINLIIIFSLLTIFFLFKFQSISRIFLLLYFFASLFFIITSRYLGLIIYRYYIKKGFYNKNILIVGSGHNVDEFVENINQHEIWGVNILGIINDDPLVVNRMNFKYKINGTLKELRKILLEHPVDELVCSVPLNKLARLQYVLETCEQIGISVIILSNFFNLVLGKSKMGNIAGIPIVTYSMTPDFILPLLIKRTFDILFSVLSIIIASPLLLMIIIIIKSTSQGQMLFVQERCGLNGRRFKMYKFRTMVNNAEELKTQLVDMNEIDGPVFKIKSDPRITWIGSILRRTSIDEIPQLFNVLKGEMSIVGPRPPIPEEVEKYEFWQRRRLSMRPGLTCLWQISGRNEISFDEWMKLDLKYIDDWGLGLDFKIILKTIPVVLFRKGAY